MGKRTSQKGLADWSDAPDLDDLVRDKRQGKRANPAKGRRRNRRYENRMLSAQIEDLAQLDGSRQDISDGNPPADRPAAPNVRPESIETDIS